MSRRSRGQRRRHAVQQRKQSEWRRAGTNDTQPPSKLMSLPAELRNRIWEDVFEGSIQELHGADYVIYRMLWDWKYCSKPVQLLLTCKQVYTEAIGIYYSSTIFFSKVKAHEQSAKKFATWMETIGVEKANLIKNVRFPISERYYQVRCIDYGVESTQEAIAWLGTPLQTVEEAVTKVHSGRLCVYGNLWYHDNRGKKGFEIWTSDPQKTDVEAHRAHTEGTEAFEKWLVSMGSAVSRWQLPDLAAIGFGVWDHDREDAFKKWYTGKYSAAAREPCGCGRFCGYYRY